LTIVNRTTIRQVPFQPTRASSYWPTPFSRRPASSSWRTARTSQWPTS